MTDTQTAQASLSAETEPLGDLARGCELGPGFLGFPQGNAYLCLPDKTLYESDLRHNVPKFHESASIGFVRKAHFQTLK